MTDRHYPGYLEQFYSGELAERAEILKQRLAACDVCPRNCGVNRLEGELGFCNSGFLPIISSVVAHHGEEPVLSGTRGSGTVFFGNCNLQCRYCQNWQISQDPQNQNANELSISELAEKMIFVQDRLHCHNINFVSPTHFVPQILLALQEAVPKGLHIPLVYNTGSYDALETIKMLDGIFDIYLPDLKYASGEISTRYSLAPDYPKYARAAIKEMYRQVGDLETDNEGIAVKGLIVRHLILPNRLAGSTDSLAWLACELSPCVTVGIMSQYHPTAQARSAAELARAITLQEYDEVVALIDDLGFENGWLQEMDSKDHYLPDFSDREKPFDA